MTNDPKTLREKVLAADQSLIDEQERIEEAIKVEAEREHKIRILDDLGHLLCIYNPVTRAIEIQVPVGRSSDRGKQFEIGLDTVLRLGDGNTFATTPVFELQAKKISNGRVTE